MLRIAVCLSALYKIPVKINNIRAGRTKPGLAAQHLKGILLSVSIRFLSIVRHRSIDF